MTTRTFAVETRAQAIAIFGGPPSLVQGLLRQLTELGFYAAPISSSTELETLSTTHDPDYLVIFPDFAASELVSALEPFIRSGDSRLILVAHRDDPLPPIAPVARTIIYSDYVGQTELRSPTIEAWLADIQATRSLTISGGGLEGLSLLGQDDLAHLLALSIILPPSSSNEELKLGDPDPISLLNLAYFLRTNLPFKLDLSFTAQQQESQPNNLGQIFRSSLAQLGYELHDSPQDILASYLTSHLQAPPPRPPLPALSPPPPTPSSPPPAPLRKLTPLHAPRPVFVPLRPKVSKRSLDSHSLKFTSVAGRGLLIALALYLGILAFASTVVILSLKHNLTTLRQNALPRPARLNILATTYLQANWLALTSISGLSTRPTITQITLLLDAYNQALSAFTSAHLLSRSTEELTHFVFGSGTGDVVQLISLSRLQTEELYQKLSLLDGSLPLNPPSVLPSKYHSPYQEVKSKLALLKRSVLTAKAVLATTPDLIGLGGRRKYAVLFQNNMELRATGGFIGSFAILSFENGKLYDMLLYDVYDADGQLKGHVEPPAPIKDVLGEANWYLRDSNFDPDFPISARRAEWFIKKSLNLDLDGTIAITLNTLSALLRSTGPLEIPDYNETISPDNLYERAQFHAEVNFFPGSTQKKEFLSTVANSLFARLPALGAGEGLKLLQELSTTLQEKDTLVSLTKDTTNHVFETLGWTGQLLDLPCPTQADCHKDYVMVVDSNFGVNKANYFIRRAIEEVITLDKDLALNHVLRLRYQNTATSTAWPAGTYKNYQRLYLPIGSTLTKLKVGETELTKDDYTITTQRDRLIISYLISVPISQSLTVELGYTTLQLPQTKELLYTWYWQKQPGTSRDDPLTVYLNYPLYLTPDVISPASELSPQQLKFTLTNDTDHRVTVKFRR